MHLWRHDDLRNTPCGRQKIFSLIISQLRGLANRTDPSFPRCFYILESLARVQSANILVDLEANEVEGGTELMVELFNAFFEVIQ